MKKCFLSVLALILWASCLSLSYADDYTVGEGDVLKIEVFKEKDFSGDFSVDSKGNLNYPIVGDIPVGGKTQEGIRLVLTEILGKDYLVNPKVSVAVKEYKSKRVMVVGSIRKPGVYNLKEKTRILDILTLAGGIEKDGSKRVIVLRRDEPVPISSRSAMHGKNVAEVGGESKNELKGEPFSESFAVEEADKSADLNIAVNEETISSQDEAADENGIETVTIASAKKDETLSKDMIGENEEMKSESSALPSTAGTKVEETQLIPTTEDKTSQKSDKAEHEEVSSMKDDAQSQMKPSQTQDAFNVRLTEASGLTPIMVNFEKILSGEDLSQNIEILGGDIINVPRANEIFVLGSVKKPGPIKYEENMGILQAMTLAGGPTPEASPGSTYILRVAEKGKKEKINVNFNKVLKHKSKNVQVKPDDVIVVPESFF